MEENNLFDDRIIEERKKKIVDFLKKKKDWIIYIFLSLIVWLGVYIRTRPISKLKDITNGAWTLGPDLDPFLFLRWAKYIAEHGKLFLIDKMRSVPLAEICSGEMCRPINTAHEMKLLSYMIVWFHKFLSFFSLTDNITHSAILFPVFMFALTTIAFFLFARKIFYKEDKIIKNLIALISTGLFVLIPSLLPRTIAGIPEKESAAFFFMFMAFYFFLEAFTSKKLKKGLIFGVLAGIFTGLMALIWGGYIFIFFTIPPAVLLAFILGKVKKKQLYIYFSWLISSFILMVPFSTRYTIKNLVVSLSTSSSIVIFVIMGASLFFMKNERINNIRRKTKLPPELFSLIISIFIILIIISIFPGPKIIVYNLKDIKNNLIQPSMSRFSFTVAENKQPYFINDWKNSFGPIFRGIPLFFWLFFIGSIFLFNSMIKSLRKKERWLLTFSYFIFLFAIIFSRYSSSKILNGINNISLLVYFGGWIFFMGCFLYIYWKKYQDNEFFEFKKFNFTYILYFIILTLGIIGARGAIRLIMVLGAVSPVVIGFFGIKVSRKFFKEKEELKKFFIGAIAITTIILIIFTFYTYFKTDKNTASNYVPDVYRWQWQKAMDWVRENTSKEAVFAHWWDYGYWVQSMGERATILDGGNAITYWNYLMGRYVLTAPNETDALGFLYSHNGTHLLIDSTEIGKYPAYSSIGSDADYDRYSWISTFSKNEKETYETKDEIFYIYKGGTATDEDIIWKDGEKEIFLPAEKTGIGAVIIKIEKQGKIAQPEAIFVYQTKQISIPLRYIYVNNKLLDFGSGLEAGVFLMPRVSTQQGKIEKIELGALLYLSKRTVNSNLARLYLYNQSENFKLVHSEPDFVLNDLEKQGLNIGDFAYIDGMGFKGPIKIWEIEYPKNIEFNPNYLITKWPSLDIKMAREDI